MRQDHSPDAEASVIGSLLLDPERALIRVREVLRPSDFFAAANGAVYAAVLELVARGVAVDVVTIADAMKRRGDLDRFGGLEYLADLAGRVPTAENVAYHARIVREKALTREVRQAAQRVLSSDAEGADLVRELQDEARLVALPSAHDILQVGEIVAAVHKEAVAAREHGPEHGALAGVPTGIEALDSRLTFGGIVRRHVTVLAGATSAGKSALANSIVLGSAKRGKSALIVALEDEARAVVCRLLSPLSGIANRQLQRRVIGEQEWDRLDEACMHLSSARLWFIDGWAGTVDDLTMRIRAFCERERVDVVVVDFLQLLRTGLKGAASRQDHADYAFGALVAMARQIDAATVVVSQLRRTRGERPTKEDLYHSGALEQWSHTIGLLWRPEVAGPAGQRCVGLLVDKQKNGPTGLVVLGWDGDHVSYSDPDPDLATEYEAAVAAKGERQ